MSSPRDSRSSASEKRSMRSSASSNSRSGGGRLASISPTRVSSTCASSPRRMRPVMRALPFSVCRWRRRSAAGAWSAGCAFQRRMPSLTAGTSSRASSRKIGSRSRSTSSLILRWSLPASNGRRRPLPRPRRLGRHRAGASATSRASTETLRRGSDGDGRGLFPGTRGRRTGSRRRRSASGWPRTRHRFRRGPAPRRPRCFHGRRSAALARCGLDAAGRAARPASSASRMTPGMRMCVPSPVRRDSCSPSRSAFRSSTRSSRAERERAAGDRANHRHHAVHRAARRGEPRRP